jgi:hypothetical protein
MQIRPAAVMGDPSSGTIPTGYRLWNVAAGAVKRHAGSYSWETTVGGNASAKAGFHAATPTAQQAGTAQAAVTCVAQTISDPPTHAQVQAVNDGLVAAITLLNELHPVSGLHSLGGSFRAVVPYGQRLKRPFAPCMPAPLAPSTARAVRAGHANARRKCRLTSPQR